MTCRIRRAAALTASILLVSALLPAMVVARKSLGGGSGLSTWSSTADEGLFAKAGRGAADGQKRAALSRLEWVVDPLDGDAVRSRLAEAGIGEKDCANAVCKYLAGRDPLRLKLRTRPVALVSSRSPKAGRDGVGLRFVPFGLSPTARR